jgi:hypothetical protein
VTAVRSVCCRTSVVIAALPAASSTWRP